MFIRYYVELPYPRAALEPGFLATLTHFLPSVSSLADERSQHLLAEVGFAVDGHRLSKEIEVEIGRPVGGEGRTWIPISWRATGPTGLFPVLEADLELASLGAHVTQLSLSGRYQPPLGLLGRTIDRALLARVAEATIKDFLDQLARVIEGRIEQFASR